MSADPAKIQEDARTENVDVLLEEASRLEVVAKQTSCHELQSRASANATHLFREAERLDG